MWLAAAYAHTGRSEDARWELEEIRIADANLSIKRIEQSFPLRIPRRESISQTVCIKPAYIRKRGYLYFLVMQYVLRVEQGRLQ